MKLQQLAEHTDTPVTTIKYYLREKLLDPGIKRNATTAVYDQSHVDRLSLIATLRQVIGMPIDRVRAVIDAVRTADPVDLMGIVQAAVLGLDEPKSTTTQDGRLSAAEVVSAMGWSTTATAAISELDRHLAVLSTWGIRSDLETLLAYARAADTVARYELGIPRALTVEGADSPSPDRIAVFVARGVYADSKLLPTLLAIAQGSLAHEHHAG